MARIFIADTANYINEDVEIWGWLFNIRSKGKIHFLQLRDATAPRDRATDSGRIRSTDGRKYHRHSNPFRITSSLRATSRVTVPILSTVKTVPAIKK